MATRYGALPWWCRWPVSAIMSRWIPNGCALVRFGYGSRLWVQQPRVVRCWQGLRPGAYGMLLADRLAGPRIGALQLPAPHACAHKCASENHPGNRSIFTTWQIRVPEEAIFRICRQLWKFIEMTEMYIQLGQYQNCTKCLNCMLNRHNLPWSPVCCAASVGQWPRLWCRPVIPDPRPIIPGSAKGPAAIAAYHFQDTRGRFPVWVFSYK